MKFNPLAKTDIPLLRKTLETYSLRQRAIAENIANVETKGYRRIKVNFEDALQEALEPKRPQGLKTNPRHMDVGKRPSEVKGEIITEDRPVNLEQEMAELAKNQVRFEFAAKMLHGSYETLRDAIRGRLR